MRGCTNRLFCRKGFRLCRCALELERNPIDVVLPDCLLGATTGLGVLIRSCIQADILKNPERAGEMMRRKDRELSGAETQKILTDGTYGVLSMNGENEHAYGVPLSYVYTDNSIYLHSASEGRKINRIRKDNRVSFCVVVEASPIADQFSMKYRSAIVFGKAYEVNQEEKLKALILFVKKYSTDEYMEKGNAYAVNSLHKTTVIRLDIEHVSGKARK